MTEPLPGVDFYLKKLQENFDRNMEKYGNLLACDCDTEECECLRDDD